MRFARPRLMTIAVIAMNSDIVVIPECESHLGIPWWPRSFKKAIVELAVMRQSHRIINPFKVFLILQFCNEKSAKAQKIGSTYYSMLLLQIQKSEIFEKNFLPILSA